MKPEEVLEVIRELNNEIDEKIEDTSSVFYFSMETDGYCSLIRFMGILIWSSEDDCREIVNDEYEPLKDYIKRETEVMIDNAIQHQKAIKYNV